MASNDAELTHLDAAGAARMVDVGHKPPLRRTAIASGFLVAAETTLDRVMVGDLPKGEALAVARIAGIQAAKRCDALIPLCHTLPLDSVAVAFDRTAANRLQVTATTTITARTGVEMEALTAVSIALLTLWDMVKGIDSNLVIEGIRLLEKRKEPTT